MAERLAEFYELYNKPYVGQITVGFSGIDPSAKGSVNIDRNGRVSGSEEEPEEIMFDHESLEGLLGGDDNDHYHLTEEEYNRLKEYPDYEEIEEMLTIGGDEEGFYHLTGNEHDRLQQIIEAVFPSEDAEAPIFINAETLNSLIDDRIAEYMNTHNDADTDSSEP